MDHLLNKKLDGWSHTHRVAVNTSINTTIIPTSIPVTSIISQGQLLRLMLFINFVSDMDFEIKCTISNEWCIQHARWKNPIQGYIDRLERSVRASLMTFDRAKHKVLHMS